MIFDAAQFHVYPDGLALDRKTMRPCPCGNAVFVRVRNQSGRTRTVCPKCVRIKSDETQIDQVAMKYAGAAALT